MLCDDLQVLCIPLSLNKEIDNAITVGLKTGKFNRPTVFLIEKKGGEAELKIFGRMVKE